MPGDSVLTRMQSRPSSWASTRTSMMRAALLGPYAPRLACGRVPDIDATATMAPPEAFRAGWAAWARSSVARTFTAKRRSQSSTGYSRSDPGRLTPALLTRPSRPPRRFTASPTTRPGASACPMSPWSAIPSAPRPPSSPTSSASAAEGARSTAAIRAGRPRAWPSRARRRQVARPIPLAAPVTRTRMDVSLRPPASPRRRGGLGAGVLKLVEAALDRCDGARPHQGVHRQRLPAGGLEPGLVAAALDEDDPARDERLLAADPLLGRVDAARRPDLGQDVVPDRHHALSR